MSKPENGGKLPTVQKIVQWITDEIMSGRFVPGQRLISAEIASKMNVSRMPVREALNILAGQNVIELLPNRGAIIKHMSAKETIDFLQLAEAICLVGVRLATEKMHIPENRKLVKSAFKKIEDSYETRNPVEFNKSLHEFHLLLNKLSGNHYIYEYYSQPIFYILVRLVAEQLPGRSWSQYIDHYRLIYDSVMSGSTYAATAATISHVQWAILLVQEHGE